MKKLALIVAILLMASFAYAESETKTVQYVGNSECESCQNFADFLNEQDCVKATYEDRYEDRENPLGIGADVTVWENERDTIAVEVQGKHDFANQETSAFAVVKLNLWDMITGDK